MKQPFDNTDKAFMPLEQTLVWHRGKAPHISSTFSGTLLQGSMETASAGVSIDPTIADAWTVRLPRFSLIVGKMSIGDTIEVDCWGGRQHLCIQQVFQDTTGDFWLVCTASQRAPNG